MRICFLLAALALAAIPITSAPAMPVATFLAKADALQKKGAMALFSGDLKRLTGQVKKDAAELKAANAALANAGKPKAYCTPSAGAKLSDKEILEAMRAVPPAHRASTSTKDALRAYLAKRHPC